MRLSSISLAITSQYGSLGIGALMRRAVSIHSLRQANPNYTGPLCRVQRSSDNAQLDIPALSNGDLDVYTLMNHVGAENKLLWSEDFSNAAWVKATCTAIGGRLTFGGIFNASTSQSLTLPASTTYTKTIWLTLVSGTVSTNNVHLAIYGAGVTTGDTLCTPTLGNLLKVSTTFTTNGTGGAVNIQIRCDELTPVVLDVYVQLNTGTTALDYCKTTSAPTTSGSGFVAKVYDQSGLARDLVQATLANMPRLVNAGVIDRMTGGTNRPMMRTDGVSQTMAAGALTLAQPITKSSVLQFQSVASGQYVSNLASEVLYFSAAGTLAMNATSDIVLASGVVANAPAVVTEIYNGASSLGSYNGATTAGNPGSTGASVGLVIGASSAAHYANALYGDLLIFPAALSTADRLALEANQKAYWGTP